MSRQGQFRSKEVLRTLRFIEELKSVEACQFGEEHQERWLLSGQDDCSRKVLCSNTTLEHLVRIELIVMKDQRCSVTALGHKRLKRARSLAADGSAFRLQHHNIVNEIVTVDGCRQSVQKNKHESPLSRLHARKFKDGTSWLSDGAYGAGEQLRRDFTRAQLMPNVSSNWDISTASTHKPTGWGGGVDLSDSALDARRRFNRAMEFVGPELAGVLTDVCCCLKGLETVEREHRWPARSAKLLLRTGLGLLARYYGTEAGVATNGDFVASTAPKAQ